VQHLGHHRREVVRVQVRQPQVLHPGRLLLPPGQQRGERVPRVHVAVPIGHDHQQALDLLLAGEEEIQQAKGRLAGPLRVVYDKGNRPRARCDRAEDLHRSPAGPDLGGQRVTGVRRNVEQGRELRKQRGGQSGIRPEGQPQPLTDLGQHLLRLGEQQPSEPAKRLVDRIDRLVAAAPVEPSQGEPTVAGGGNGPQLLDQRGLADARTATDHNPAALSGAHPLKR